MLSEDIRRFAAHLVWAADAQVTFDVAFIEQTLEGYAERAEALERHVVPDAARLPSPARGGHAGGVVRLDDYRVVGRR